MRRWSVADASEVAVAGHNDVCRALKENGEDVAAGHLVATDDDDRCRRVRILVDTDLMVENYGQRLPGINGLWVSFRVERVALLHPHHETLFSQQVKIYFCRST